MPIKEQDYELIVFIWHKEDPVRKMAGRNLRIFYNGQWVDFINGEVKITKEKEASPC